MIYAYDQWAQLPVRDLYNTQVMAMAISAAKDMYDKGEQQMKDFKKEYGDFYTPNQVDMDWYNKNVIGKVHDVINSLYAAGIDPLRSVEGRQIISRTINNIDYGRIASAKQQADIINEYNKNKSILQRDNKFNSLYEQSILGYDKEGNPITPETWDVDKMGRLFDRHSPSVYQDLNQFTGHLFDKMDDEFMGTDKQGRDWYGISPERRMKALTPLMGDLLNTDLGKFHYEQSRKNAAFLLNRTPTEEEVMDQFAKDIITATDEYDRRNYKENPEYARQRNAQKQMQVHAANAAVDHEYKLKERANTPGYDSNGNPISQTTDGYSLKELGYNSAIANVMGSQYDRNNMDYDKAGKNIKSVQRQFGSSVGENKYAFKNKYTSYDSMHVEDIKQLHGGNITDLGFQANFGDLLKLRSSDDVITNTYGYKGERTNNSNVMIDKITAALNSGNFVEIMPKDGIYGAYTYDSDFSIDAPVRVRIYSDAEGNTIQEDFDAYWNVGWNSQKDNTVVNQYQSPYPLLGNDITAEGRLWKRWNNSISTKLTEQDSANLYPYQWDASSETQATHKQLNVPFTSLGTLYK